MNSGPERDGPSMEQYVETRFSLLNVMMGEALKNVDERAAAADKRYQQRYDAQQNAFNIAVETSRGTHADILASVHAEIKAINQMFDGAAALSNDRLAALKEKIGALERGIDTRFQTTELAFATAQMAMKEASIKSDRATELRFESVNEFRRTLAEQTATFQTTAAFDEAQKSSAAYRESVTSRFEQVNTRLNLREGQNTGSKERSDESRANWAMVVAIGSIAVTFLVSIIPSLTARNSTAAVASPLYNVPPGYKLAPVEK